MIGGEDSVDDQRRLNRKPLDRALARHRTSFAQLRAVEAKFGAWAVESSLAVNRITRFGGRIALALREQPDIWNSKMTVSQAATFLGRSERTIRRRISDGQLAAVREGRRTLIPETQLWQLTARHLSAAARPDPTRAAGIRWSPSQTQTRTRRSRGVVGHWAATVDGEVIVEAETAREVVAWLEEHDRVADSMFRLPLSQQATEGVAPA